MARKTRLSVYYPAEDREFTKLLRSMTDIEKVELLRLLYEGLTADNYRFACELNIPIEVVDDIQEHADNLERAILARDALKRKPKKEERLSPPSMKRRTG